MIIPFYLYDSIFHFYFEMKPEDIKKLKLDEIMINFAIPKYKNGLTLLYKIPHFSKVIAERREEFHCLIY